MNFLEKTTEKIVNHKYYRRSKNFSKYLFIGILWTLLNIFLMWLSIDILKFPTVYAASAVVVVLFTGKFYIYRLVNLIENKFLKYTSATLVFNVASIFFMWLLVDVAKLSALNSSAIITLGLFILRYLFYYKASLIIE